MDSSKVVRIGSIEARPGEKRVGFLKVGETPLSDINLPIAIVNGAKPGPTLSLIAGEHAMEYAGIDAAIEILKRTEPKDLSGTLIVAPIANSPAFETRTSYVCPIDNVNIAPVPYPETQGKTIGHIIAQTILEEVMLKGDYIVKLHGGEYTEWQEPFSIARVGDDEKSTVDATSIRLAEIFGDRYVLIFRDPRRWGPTPTVRVPYIVADAGGLGRFDEADITHLVTGVTNVMKYLRMIPGKPPEKPAHQEYIFNSRLINAKRGGLLYPIAKAEDVVSKGDLLAEIRDVWGDTKEKVISPDNGVILVMVYRHVVNTGDLLYSLGAVSKTPRFPPPR